MSFNRSPFDLLGLETTESNPEVIIAAYKKSMSNKHPDKRMQRGEQVGDQAQEEASALTASKDVLLDSSSRQMFQAFAKYFTKYPARFDWKNIWNLIKDVKADNKNLCDNSRDQLQRANNLITDLEIKFANSQTRVRSLENEFASEKAKTSDLKEKMKRCESQISEMREKLKTDRTELLTNEMCIKLDLALREKELNEKSEELKKCQRQLNKMSLEIQETNRKLELSTSPTLVSVSSLTAPETDNIPLDDNCTSRLDDANALGNCGNLQATTNLSGSPVDNRKSEHDVLLPEMESLKAKLVQLENQCKEKDVEIGKLKEDSRKQALLKSQFDECEDKLNKRQRSKSCEKLQEELTAKDIEISKLVKELDVEKNERQKAVEDLAKMSDDMVIKLQQMAEVEENLEKYHEHIQMLKGMCPINAPEIRQNPEKSTSAHASNAVQSSSQQCSTQRNKNDATQSVSTSESQQANVDVDVRPRKRKRKSTNTPPENLEAYLDPTKVVITDKTGKKHAKIIYGGKVWCLCGSLFGSSLTFTRHIRELNYNFVCSKLGCGFSTKRKENVERHEFIKHGIEKIKLLEEREAGKRSETTSDHSREAAKKRKL